MCGIGGWFETGENSPENKTLIHKIATTVFEATKTRGTDASGFSWINKFEELNTVKGPVASPNFIKDPKWSKLKNELPKSLIFHCRRMTAGSPANNYNNHPLVAAKEISVVHNGCISNHVELKKKYKLKGKGMVDSEIIPMLIRHFVMDLTDNYTKTVTEEIVAKAASMAAQEFTGGFACAMLFNKTPDALYLITHNNPTVLAYSKTLNCLFFASEKTLMEKGFNVESNVELELGLFDEFKHKFSIKKIKDNTITVIKNVEAEEDAQKASKKSAKSGVSIRFYSLMAGVVGEKEWNSKKQKWSGGQKRVKRELMTKKEGLEEAGVYSSASEDWNRPGGGYSHGHGVY